MVNRKRLQYIVADSFDNDLTVCVGDYEIICRFIGCSQDRIYRSSNTGIKINGRWKILKLENEKGEHMKSEVDVGICVECDEWLTKNDLIPHTSSIYQCKGCGHPNKIDTEEERNSDD